MDLFEQSVRQRQNTARRAYHIALAEEQQRAAAERRAERRSEDPSLSSVSAYVCAYNLGILCAPTEYSYKARYRTDASGRLVAHNVQFVRARARVNN